MLIMDLMLVERMLGSGDARRMGDAAKDLGRLLTTRQTEQQTRVLDVLGRLDREDEFGRGFVVALRHVFNAFAAALEREQSDAELTRLAEREGVRDILVALGRGDRLPSQLAERTGRSKSQITALLKYVESVGLIEDELHSSDDARTRPRALTTRGAILASQLVGHEDGAVLAEVDRTVAAVVETIAALVARQHVARSDLAELLGRRLPTAAAHRALTALEQAAELQGLAVTVDETMWFVENQLQDVVADHLARATDQDEPALRALLPSLTTGRLILVRTGQQHKDAWCRLKQVHALDRVEVIGPGEARLGDRGAPGEEFDVLYDSGALARLDLGSENRTRYVEPARTRCQHGVKQSTVPDTFERVLLEG